MVSWLWAYCDRGWLDSDKIGFLQCGGAANGISQLGGGYAYGIDDTSNNTLWNIGCGLSCDIYSFNNSIMGYLRLGGGSISNKTTGGVFASAIDIVEQSSWPIGCGLSCDRFNYYDTNLRYLIAGGRVGYDNHDGAFCFDVADSIASANSVIGCGLSCDYSANSNSNMYYPYFGGRAANRSNTAANGMVTFSVVEDYSYGYWHIGCGLSCGAVPINE